jgi:hypothetical protein
MKKPTQVLFRKCQLKSISEIERRLAMISEMQRSLDAIKVTLVRPSCAHPRFEK